MDTSLQPTGGHAARAIGAVTSLGFGLVGILHYIWLVSPWPLSTWAAWSHAFGGPAFRVSPIIMTLVATLFVLAAYVVAARAKLVRARGSFWLYRAGCWVIALVFVSRAILGFIEMSRSPNNPQMTDGFRETTHFYLTIYLPVFLVLGVLTAIVELTSARTKATASIGY